MDANESAGGSAASAAEASSSALMLPPERTFAGFVFETVVGLQCCCSVGSVRNPDGYWTELLLLSIDAHGNLTRDEAGIIQHDSLLSGGLQLGILHSSPEFHDNSSQPAFRPLLFSDDRAMKPADMQCHALDEAGAPLLAQDRLVRVISM